MSGVDRLGHQFYGAACEVSGCGFSAESGEGWDGKPDQRCYDHSISRLVDEIIIKVPCQFGTANCTTHSSKVNEYNVHMCDYCYNVWVRIQNGGRGRVR
jgi:hypothetical protein